MDGNLSTRPQSLQRSAEAAAYVANALAQMRILPRLFTMFSIAELRLLADQAARLHVAADLAATQLEHADHADRRELASARGG